MKFVSKLLYSGVAVAAIGLGLLLATGTGTPLLADERATAETAAPAHDLYNPARTALVNARRQLAETFRQEQDILKQRQSVHRELDESLKLLATAEQIDPSMKAPIEALREQIAELERDPCASKYEGETLKELYDKLLAEFEALIEHY